MKDKQRKGLTNIQILCITGIVLLVILCVLLIYGAITVASSRSILQNGETKIAVYKTVTSHFGGSIGQNHSTYFAEYYYEDVNGKVYKGESPLGYRTEEEARKLINSQVEIKIGGNGKSVPVGIEIDSPIWYIIVSSISFILILGLIFLCILEELKKRKRVLTYREVFKKEQQ